jgi:hypothetical protein
MGFPKNSAFHQDNSYDPLALDPLDPTHVLPEVEAAVKTATVHLSTFERWISDLEYAVSGLDGYEVEEVRLIVEEMQSHLPG